MNIMVKYKRNNNKENIFREEKKLFELTEKTTYTKLTKKQQNELKEQLNPQKYHVFIYDTNLPEKIIKQYYVQQKLYQPTEIYTTTKITKPTKNVRYIIFSKEFQEINERETQTPYKNMNLAMSGILNCFKVTDIIKKENITYITLLHYNSFEELIIKHHKTEIENKSVKKTEEIINKKYSTIAVNLDEINYKITKGIGINNHSDELKPYLKDHVIFLLDVLSDLLDTYDMNKVLEFISHYDVTYIINVYQNSINELKKIKVNEYTDFNEEKEKITNAYKNTILNSIKISENFKEDNTIKTNLSENYHELETDEKIDEISEILNIPQKKIEELINLNENKKNNMENKN